MRIMKYKHVLHLKVMLKSSATFEMCSIRNVRLLPCLGGHGAYTKKAFKPFSHRIEQRNFIATEHCIT